MKRAFLFLAMLLMGVLTFADKTITVSANTEDISQSLDLRVVAKLFAEASTTEQFEITLNNPDSAYSNLDLNGDGNIDYLRVVETGYNNSRLIIIQAVLAKDIYQDVASIYVEKDKQEQVSVQIIGDEYVYGTDYIIEPVYIYRPIIYTYLWSHYWRAWYSPWYWGYYPHWWYYRPCYSYRWYWDRCYRFHHHHYYCSFHHGHHPHHGYHTINNSISHREYATQHPNNSFSSRNTGYRNAGEIRRSSASSQRETSIKPNNYSRTFDSRNTAVQRSGNSTKSTQPTSSQRTTHSSTVTRRPTGQSGVSTTHQTTQSSNSNRTTVSTHQRPNNGQITRRPTSNSTYRPNNNTTSPARSAGSFSSGSRPSGGRTSASAPSRPSGGVSTRR